MIPEEIDSPGILQKMLTVGPLQPVKRLRSNSFVLTVAQNVREICCVVHKSRKIFCSSIFYPINQVTIATRSLLYVTKILYRMILKLFYKVQTRKFTISVLSRAGNSLIRSSLIHSFRSNQMSDCE